MKYYFPIITKKTTDSLKAPGGAFNFVEITGVEPVTFSPKAFKQANGYPAEFISHSICFRHFFLLSLLLHDC
jgi:hypothetical protein